MVLAHSSGGLVRAVRGELADVGESEVAVAAQNHRAELATARSVPLRPRGGARFHRAVIADEEGASAASISGPREVITSFASLRSKWGSTESHPNGWLRLGHSVNPALGEFCFHHARFV